MSKYATNLDQLINMLTDEVTDVMNSDVGKKAADVTKRNIDKSVYKYDPEEYQRTYQLRDSIKNFPAKVVGNTVEVEIDHDKSMIISDPDNYTHGSPYYSPQNISSFLDIIVAEGKSGDLFGNGFWRQKRQYFNVTVQDLIQTGEHIQAMKAGFRRKGYDVR
ncbi:hypothetical protein BEH_07205 [Priestia filamentosa]|uniref:Uncharacterized protein n=1 Tax=Priestia filamentosa TaxID=1402861 RepID=A0A0H4KCS2_9BACI|nr:hypothetical protein [Priestia filamentosa]AKO91907.1 hypothetical protein BEH_07205 [Priestia filamentosa]